MAQWFWNASPDPFSSSTPADWRDYSPQDNQKIEQSYNLKEKKASLDTHEIYFAERMQVSKDDFNKQRPVKRVPS